MSQSYVKVVCSTGKTVYLREMKISDSEKAAQKVSRKADGDALLMQVMMPKELLKLLICKVADKEEDKPRDISAIEREDMDGLFKIVEYGQLMKAVNKMSGGDEMGNDRPMEFVQLE